MIDPPVSSWAGKSVDWRCIAGLAGILIYKYGDFHCHVGLLEDNWYNTMRCIILLIFIDTAMRIVWETVPHGVHMVFMNFMNSRLFRQASCSRGWRKTSFAGATSPVFFGSDLSMSWFKGKSTGNISKPLKVPDIFPIQPVQWIWKCQFRDTVCSRSSRAQLVPPGTVSSKWDRLCSLAPGLAFWNALVGAGWSFVMLTIWDGKSQCLTDVSDIKVSRFKGSEPGTRSSFFPILFPILFHWNCRRTPMPWRPKWKRCGGEPSLGRIARPHIAHGLAVYNNIIQINTV